MEVVKYYVVTLNNKLGVSPVKDIKNTHNYTICNIWTATIIER